MDHGSGSPRAVANQWYLVTVSLIWEQRADGSHLAARALDLLLDDEHMAGARVSRALATAPAELYHRIDVRAECREDARFRALAPAGRTRRELGGTTAVTDVQALTVGELGEHQRTISYGAFERN